MNTPAKYGISALGRAKAHSMSPICAGTRKVTKADTLTFVAPSSKAKSKKRAASSSEKAVKPFYDDFCRSASSHLLSHTDLANPVPDTSGLCRTKTSGDSWFDVKIYHSDNTAGHGLKLPSYNDKTQVMAIPDKAVKTRLVRIYPNKEQKTEFKQWFGVARKTYNTAVNYYNSNGKNAKHWMAASKEIRSTLTEDYFDKVPYKVKDVAVRDCYNAYINGIKKYKKTGKPFHLKYRSRKDPSQSCFIPKSALNEAGIYVSYTKKLKMAETDWLKEDYKDSRLLFENGRWYLCVPVETKPDTFVSENQRNGDVVAIDPGVRTFAAYFSKDGNFGKIGEGCFQRIMDLHWKLDRLISKRAKEKSKKRKRVLTRAIGRVRWKIHNLVDELHNKAALFFAENFAVVFLPTFETSQMVRRKGRKRRLRRVTVRAMQSLRFYEFSQKLERKCAERGTRCVRVNEAYTSKTNSFTGELMPKLGSAKGFRHEGVWVDRDLNGARNILLRALRDSSVRA